MAGVGPQINEKESSAGLRVRLHFFHEFYVVTRRQDVDSIRGNERIVIFERRIFEQVSFQYINPTGFRFSDQLFLGDGACPKQLEKGTFRLG